MSQQPDDEHPAPDWSDAASRAFALARGLRPPPPPPPPRKLSPAAQRKVDASPPTRSGVVPGSRRQWLSDEEYAERQDRRRAVIAEANRQMLGGAPER